jgi:FtsK/SpoIIIE family
MATGAQIRQALFEGSGQVTGRIPLLATLLIGCGFLLLVTQWNIAAFFAAIVAASIYTRAQQLGWIFRFTHGWRRWRELKPSLDEIAKMKPEQRQRRRVYRLGRGSYAFFHCRLDASPVMVLHGYFGRFCHYAKIYDGYSATPIYDRDLEKMHDLLERFPEFGFWDRVRARRFIWAVVCHKALKGRMNDLVQCWSPLVRLYVACFTLGLADRKACPMADLRHSRLAQGIAVYRTALGAMATDVLEGEREYFENLCGGEVVFKPGPVAGSVMVIRLIRFGEKVELSLQGVAQLSQQFVAIGRDRLSGEQVEIDVNKMFHLLICGASRWGKSALLHCMLWQLLMKPIKQASKFYMCDLKGGIELAQYAEQYPKRVEMVYDVHGVMKVAEKLIKELDRRLVYMRKKKWKSWKLDRIFFVVDEFAIILQARARKNDKALDAKLDQMRLDLLRLSQQAAAAGIVIVTAIQKATTDGMDSTFRANFEGIFCFHVQAKVTAGCLLGPTENLLLDPTTQLGKGEAIYRDPVAGTDRYLRVYWTTAAEDGAVDMNVDDWDPEITEEDVVVDLEPKAKLKMAA